MTIAPKNSGLARGACEADHEIVDQRIAPPLLIARCEQETHTTSADDGEGEVAPADEGGKTTAVTIANITIFA